MTITTEQLDNLRGLIKFALPLPWKWWTSNSNTRLTSAVGKDGDVIHAVKAVDGHTCVNISSDNMNLIASAVNALPELLAHIDTQEARIVSTDAMLTESVEALRLSEKELEALRADNETLVAVNSELANELEVLRAQEPAMCIAPVPGEKGMWREVGRDYHRGRHVWFKPVPAAPVAVPDVDSFSYDDLFKAISAATVIESGAISVSVTTFREVLRLNSGSNPVDAPDDLVMQIRRLVHALKNAKPDHSLVKSVPDYMRKKGYWKVTDCLRDSGSNKK